MVGIINYGAGNIFSIYSAIKICGCTPFLIENHRDIKKAGIIVIPGVGAFDDGMNFLIKTGIGEVIKTEIERGKFFLGICLGLQLLFQKSEEGNLNGLGILEGIVKKFSFSNMSIKVPHMGWNKVKQKKKNILFSNIPDNSYFYFAHSYYADVNKKEIIYGITKHYIEFPSIVIENNIVGVQFHPEKSGKYGLQFLKNFFLNFSKMN